MAITRHISHIKSKLTENGGPKLPAANQLLEGEIAVNYAKGYETLSIKNESGDVITFSSDSYYADKKLGSGFTGENSANTVTSVIESNERVVAASLNDLNARKLDASAYTPTDLSNYYTKSEVYAKGETSGATELTEAFDNFYTKDEIDNAELAISAALNDIETNKMDISGLSDYYNKEYIDEIELVASTALNDLNERKLDASAYTPIDITNYYNKTEVNGLLDDKSEVISGSLNDLNKRVNYAIATAGSVDLSNYYTKDEVYAKSETSGATEIQGALSGKQNTLSAGTNISIANDVISVTGLSFSIDQEISSGTSASTNAVSTKAVFDVIKENEEIISSSLNDLNDRIIALEEIINSMQQQNP